MLVDRRRCEERRVEVAFLDARAVDEHQPLDPHRRHCRQETSHHLGARHREQQIEAQRRGRTLEKPDGERDLAVAERRHHALTHHSSQQTDSQPVANGRAVDLLNVTRSRAVQHRLTIAGQIAVFEQHKVHVSILTCATPHRETSSPQPS